MKKKVANMCFEYKLTQLKDKLEKRYGSQFNGKFIYHPKDLIKGFDHPLSAVITSATPEEISQAEWGLLPSWASDKSMQNSTLNARIETLREKPAFNGVLNQKCLVLMDGFYDWKHLPGGKVKEKYLLTRPDKEPFAVAGLFSHWRNPETGDLTTTFTIITTEARGIMREIHNSKLRMPVVLQPEIERAWLSGNTTAKLFTELEAEKVGGGSDNSIPGLF